MKKWFHHLTTVLAVGAAVQGIGQQAIAQTYLEGRYPTYPEHTNDVFTRALYYESRDTFESFRTGQVLNDSFGVSPFGIDGSGYPEHRAKRDIKKIDILYRDIMLQQVGSDPVIRTQDLPNPFNSSLLTEGSVGNTPGY
ncbi:hypothetical protein NIES970_12980 [[Synechococcus] sp. NIES-970]|nr:hypothetical protein NIES970_12980 [[Synechococcus] sp. NIES-970]